MDEPKADDFLRDLALVPAWARQPAAGGIQFSVREKSRRALEKSNGRPAHRPLSDRSSGRKGISFNPAVADRKASRAHSAVEDAPKNVLDERCLRIGFIPEQRGLKPLAHYFAGTRRAWPLEEVAKKFLSRPEFYAVKLELCQDDKPASDKSAAALLLFQCQECRQVFCEKETAETHVLQKHFERFIEKTTQAGEPPKGNFTCVARCTLSNTLLGPPNCHLYQENVLELHRRRFAHMPLEDYRRRIVNESDPALIEQWKKEAAVQTVYRVRDLTPEKSFTRFSEAEAYFREHFLPRILKSGRRFIVPGKAWDEEGADPHLKQLVQRVLNRELHVPRRILLAVRPAFRHLGMHFFRADDKTVYMTAIAPRPLGDVQTTEDIAFIRRYLSEHDKALASDLAQNWSASAPARSAADIANPLHWLIERGHVIEFFDGKLTLARPEFLPYADAGGASPAAANAGQGREKHG